MTKDQIKELQIDRAIDAAKALPENDTSWRNSNPPSKHEPFPKEKVLITSATTAKVWVRHESGPYTYVNVHFKEVVDQTNKLEVPATNLAPNSGTKFGRVFGLIVVVAIIIAVAMTLL